MIFKALITMVKNDAFSYETFENGNSSNEGFHSYTDMLINNMLFLPWSPKFNTPNIVMMYFSPVKKNQEMEIIHCMNWS